MLLHCTALPQARSQESQLEFAHQQLDMRQQELQVQAGAAQAAQASVQQLQDTVASLTEELTRSRREAETGETGWGQSHAG